MDHTERGGENGRLMEEVVWMEGGQIKVRRTVVSAVLKLFISVKQKTNLKRQREGIKGIC